MTLVAGGDLAAFRALMERWEGAAKRYAYRVFGDYQVAEDVAQDTFVRLFRSAERYKPTARFSTYFYTVLNNLCLDTLRRMHKKSLPDFQAFENPVLDGMPSESAHGRPEDHAQVREEQRLVREAIDKLPESQRKVIVLRELEELKYREIAEVCHLSLNEVKVLIHRGRKALLRILQRSPLFEGSEST